MVVGVYIYQCKYHEKVIGSERANNFGSSVNSDANNDGGDCGLCPSYSQDGWPTIVVATNWRYREIGHFKLLSNWTGGAPGL